MKTLSISTSFGLIIGKLCTMPFVVILICALFWGNLFYKHAAWGYFETSCRSEVVKGKVHSLPNENEGRPLSDCVMTCLVYIECG